MLQTRYKDQEGPDLSRVVETESAEARPKGLRLYDYQNDVSYDVPLDRTFTIGRTPENDIVVPIGFVSRCHCRIENGVYLFDGNGKPSANGTYVNGKRVTGRKILRPNDKITLVDPNSENLGLFIVYKQEEE